MQIEWIKTYAVFYIWKNGRRLFCCRLLIIFISFYECLYFPRKHSFLPFVHNCILHFVLNNILFPSCVMYIHFRNPHAPDYQIKTSIPYIDVQNKHLKPDISKFHLMMSLIALLLRTRMILNQEFLVVKYD